MLYKQLNKTDFDKLGISPENIIEKPQTKLKPNADSKLSTTYDVAVDFTDVTVDQLREFAAQKLVISFANGNRKKHFDEIKKAVDAGKTIVLLSAKTIGTRVAVEISPEKAISKITTVDAAERATMLAMAKYREMLKAAGMPASEIQKKLSSFKDAK